MMRMGDEVEVGDDEDINEKNEVEDDEVDGGDDDDGDGNNEDEKGSER